MIFAAAATAVAAAAVSAPVGRRPEPVVNISVIRPRPGQMEAFIALQLEQHGRLRGQVRGLRGARLFRSDDGVVLISVFDAPADAEAFRADPRFIEHLARVRPLLERVEAGAYAQAYALGAV